MNIVLGVGALILVHILVWLTTNLQLVDGWKDSGKIWCVIVGLAIPTSLVAAYATKMLYASLDSAWSIRFIGFGTSYLIFPVMTWLLLGESMFTLKTTICIALSIVILVIQLKM
ncbi:MAG: hypothetical protein VXW76_03465 [Actinomycetota bacterium]|nr:hypothetical protein [Actinomycetota bacterium]